MWGACIYVKIVENPKFQKSTDKFYRKWGPGVSAIVTQFNVSRSCVHSFVGHSGVLFWICLASKLSCVGAVCFREKVKNRKSTMLRLCSEVILKRVEMSTAAKTLSVCNRGYVN